MIANHPTTDKYLKYLVYIESFCKIGLDWTPHPGQRRWLMSSPRAQTAVLVTGRRWGKTEVVAIQALHHALTRPRSRQGIVSVTLDQARLSFDVITSRCLEHPFLRLFIKEFRQTPFPYVKFANGSEITVRTAAREGVYLRGHKFDRVIVDEADYLSERIINEVVRMTLADTGGQLILASTPRAYRGLVYRELQRGLAGDLSVYAQQGSTFENPNVDHDYILSLRDRMTNAAWKREIEGVYTSDDTAVFCWDDIQAAYENSSWILPEDANHAKRYVHGVDIAKHVDWTVHVVLDATTLPYRVVFFDRYRRVPWPAVTDRIRRVHSMYRCDETIIDATGVGDAILDEISDVARGYVFTQKSKLDLLTNLQLMFEKRMIKFPFIRDLVDELQVYAWDDAKLQTDCVMALALAAWAAHPHRRVEFAPSLWH